MLAYLAMMAPRLTELRRVLKPNGSLWLHCDSTAGCYLHVLLDAVFRPQNFRAEVVWQRSSAHNDTAQGLKQPGRVHDLLLFYTKSDEWTWNAVFVPYSDEYMAERFVHADQRGRYKDADLTAAKPGGDTSYDWRIKRTKDGEWASDLADEWKTPNAEWEYRAAKPSSGRYWAYSRENMRAFAEADRLHYFSSGTPRLKQYADAMAGVALQDIWTDIPPINSQAQERLGYPTQKPEALLERIIAVSSNEGDLVLDPFCGCGTTIAAAQKLKRRWIGIDITHLAIGLIKTRLKDAYGEGIKDTYDIIGEPTSVDDAKALAASDPYQFQWWALSLVHARPDEQKKGKDRGIDGRIYFHDDTSADTKSIVISVKAGHTGPDHVRDLVGVVTREKATIGVLITMETPTKEMRKEAASGEFYLSEWGSHPKIQLLTVADLLAGKGINRPPDRQTGATFKRAPKARPKGHRDVRLPEID
jgi:DNA modification methylase